jgi:hypothetical protein
MTWACFRWYVETSLRYASLSGVVSIAGGAAAGPAAAPPADGAAADVHAADAAALLRRMEEDAVQKAASSIREVAALTGSFRSVLFDAGAAQSDALLVRMKQFSVS